MSKPGKTALLQKRRSPEFVFCAAALLGIAVVLLCILASHGDLIRQYFFYDDLDTGMDFFHSIEYVKGRMPYALFDTLYPPLANVFFYLLYLLIPKEVSETWANTYEGSLSMRGTSTDLRSNQAAMMLFLIFLIFCVYVMYVMMDKLLASGVRNSRGVIFCALFSYGMLYAVERGNIILLCWICMAYFLCYREADSAFVRELAYLSLAVAAGLKLYPAFLGILLLKERKIMPAIRTILYGIGVILLPLYFFNEGLMGLGMWVKIVFGFGSNTKHPGVGNGFANILANIGYGVDSLYGTDWAAKDYALFGIAVALLLVVCSFFMEKEWEAVLTLVLAMGLFQSQADYVYCLYLLPLLLFLAQEKRLDRGNAVPFGVMLLFTIQLPLFHAKKNSDFTPRNLLFQILLVVLMVWCVTQALQQAKNCVIQRQPKERIYSGRKEVIATAMVAVFLVAGNVAGQQFWQRIRNWGYDYGFDSGIEEKEHKDFILTDEETGEELHVQWCINGAYFVIYNHSPIPKTFRVSFKTGYRMDRSQPHSMYFFTGETAYRVVVEESTDEVACELKVDPGETRVEISYLGPKVTTKNQMGENLDLRFTVADFTLQELPAA